jgi:glycosyltransferase involved in cell wall biosynthesis
VGGVADYTRQIAHGLAGCGDEVHVFAPDLPPATTVDGPVTVHPLPRRFDATARELVRREIGRLKHEASPRRVIVLVEYVPQGFGCRGMNVGLAWWLRHVSPRLWVMFHEVAYDFNRAQPFRHHLLAGVQHFMAGLVARKAEEVWVSVPAWERMLRRVCRPRKPVHWLPIPSNLPTEVPVFLTQRAKLSWPWPNTKTILGYFGTYSAPLAAAMTNLLEHVLSAKPYSAAVLLGKGSDEFARRFAAAFPHLSTRLLGRGVLSAERAAAELAAVDLAIYPYPDGVSSRRTSLMAALALGRPVVTTEGWLTEHVWRETKAVELVSAGDTEGFSAAVGRLLADSQGRHDLGLQGQKLYRSRFAIERVIAALRATAGKESYASC